MTNHSTPLLVGAGQVPRHVGNRQQRNVEAIAESDEPGCLIGGIHVKTAGEMHGLVGDDANGVAVQPPESNDHVLGKVRLNLKKIAVVHNRLDDLLHIVGRPGIVRHDGIQSWVDTIREVASVNSRGDLPVVARQKRQ